MEFIDKRFDWLLAAAPTALYVLYFYGWAAGLLSFVLIAVFMLAKPVEPFFSRPWMKIMFACGAMLALSLLLRFVFQSAFCEIHYSTAFGGVRGADSLSGQFFSYQLNSALVESCVENVFDVHVKWFRDLIMPIIGVALAVYSYRNRERDISL